MTPVEIGSAIGGGCVALVTTTALVVKVVRDKRNGRGPYRQAADSTKLDELVNIAREQLAVQRRTLEAVQQGNGEHQVQRVMLETIERKVCR